MTISRGCGFFLVIAFIAATACMPSDTFGQPVSGNALSPATNGVSIHTAAAYQGYALIAPMNSTSTYLVDMEGRLVREWKSEYTPSLSAYLLENGHLLRPANNRGEGGFGPGMGGRIQEFDWDGDLVWDFVLDLDGIQPHHDICKLPDGNVLVIASEPKSREAAIAAGRNPESVGEQLLPDCLLEIKPTGPTTGEVVWEWHAWDHLVQDADRSKPNYGEVSEHPELIDIDFGSGEFDRMMADPQQLSRLRSLGYVGGGGPPARDGDGQDQGRSGNPPAGAPPEERPPGDGPRGRDRGRGGPMQGDWMHTNSVAYNPALDQIVLSIHNFSEIWIIDHGTTTAEAASHAGGKRGHGGDLLYRWGNPLAYRTGSRTDQRLFAQHCAYWIPEGLPGAGHLMVFNNGQGRPNGTYSSVDEIQLPLLDDGTYQREEYLAFGPDRATWSYGSPDNTSFFSMMISGAQRLPNGNTFICSGNQGLLFEVTSSGEIVWVYKHPGGGDFPGSRSGRVGMFPEFVQRMLEVSDEQRQRLSDLQADIQKRLATVLTVGQRSQIEQPPQVAFGGPPGGLGPGPGGDRPRFPGFRPPRFGEVVSASIVSELKLTKDQESSITGLQSDVDARLAEILNAEQREQLSEMETAMARGPGFGPPPDSDGRRRDDGLGGDQPQPRRGPGGLFGGRPMPGGGGGPGGIFRSYRYGSDYPGLAGKELVPGDGLSAILERSQRPPSGR